MTNTKIQNPKLRKIAKIMRSYCKYHKTAPTPDDVVLSDIEKVIKGDS